MSANFVGKYQRTSAEKYEEFLAALGVNYLLRKAATVSTPVMEVSEVHFPFPGLAFELSLELNCCLRCILRPRVAPLTTQTSTNTICTFTNLQVWNLVVICRASLPSNVRNLMLNLV